MAAEAGNGRPFVGRVEAVEALHRRFEDARAGNGGVTLLVGDTGVGKSTLIESLVADMRGRGIRVLEGRAPPLDAPPPFALVRSAIESGRAEAASPTLGSMLGLGPSGADSVIIGFAPRLDDGRLAEPVQIEDRLLAALGEADERPESARDPLWVGIAEQFFEFTRHGPTVLVLEDLHRADEPSLEAIEYLARQLQSRPLWILATVRSLAALPTAARVRLEAFEAATNARRIVLRPLTSGEVGDFLRRREPQRVFSAEEITRHYSETGGNPLLLEQLERRLRGPGDVRASGSPTAETAAAILPTLDDGARRAIAVAAVLGPQFPFALLLRAGGEEEEPLAEAVDRLVGRGLLRERPGEVLAFVDDRFREQVYQQLTESRQRLLHRRAGEALETMGSADVATIYALARHYYLGKADEKSVQYNRAAAEIADRAFAPEIAREHLERALESYRRVRPDDWDGETEIVIELAQAIDLVGELKEAEALLRAHLARRGLRKRLSPHILALLQLYIARIQTDRGEWKEAERSTRAVLSSSDLTAHPLVLARLHHLLGETLYYEGRYAEALGEHTEELRLARQSGNERATALGQVRRANVLAMMGESESALAEAREAARTLERLGDAREAAHAHLFIGVVTAGAKGPTPRYAESLSEFEEAIRLAERSHDLRRVGWALFNTADILREAGRLDEATERNRRSRETLERIGDRFGVVQSMIVAGKIALDRGEYDRAEADLLEAYRIVRELKAPADEVDVVLRLAQLSYARGDSASARRRVAELERQNLPALRPDVVADFERLKKALAPGTGDAPPA
ncbi:MAG TPA: AAA family ATPase [Thermoplasmata archaeon]|jgi:tetratricopeptide (TPR) repeat protein|nr:AAA family ATPase [Thermoplasmata archaeon]